MESRHQNPVQMSCVFHQNQIAPTEKGIKKTICGSTHYVFVDSLPSKKQTIHPTVHLEPGSSFTLGFLDSMILLELPQAKSAIKPMQQPRAQEKGKGSCLERKDSWTYVFRLASRTASSEKKTFHGYGFPVFSNSAESAFAHIVLSRELFRLSKWT